MRGNSEKFSSEFREEREGERYMESPASPRLSGVERNSAQFGGA